MGYTLEDYVIRELIEKKKDVLNLKLEIEKLQKEVAVCHKFLAEIAEAAEIVESEYFGDYLNLRCNVNGKETPELMAYFKMKIAEQMGPIND